MSLILDALNRSRLDREPVPGLGSEHFMAEPTKRWREHLPWAGLLVALVVIAGLLLDTGQPERVSALAPVAEEISPAPGESRDTSSKTEVSQGRLSPPAIPAVEIQESDQTISVVDLPQVEPASRPLDPEVASLYQQPLEGDTPPQREQSLTSVSEASPPQEEAGPQLTRSEEALDIEKMVRQARDEMANADLVDHPAPFIADLSQQSKDTIPTVYYQRHNYSGDPGSSRVGLNGESLKVGESPMAGMRVKEILPDSVVLDYRGTEFRLRALNSWINL